MARPPTQLEQMPPVGSVVGGMSRYGAVALGPSGPGVHWLVLCVRAVVSDWSVSSSWGGTPGGATAASPSRVKQVTVWPGWVSTMVVSAKTHRSSPFWSGALKPPSRPTTRDHSVGGAVSGLV